jgi:DNA (cytosine-5)-methyltransferase 1
MTLKLFELFAGYGGASFALQKAGIDFTCVGYSEIYPNAIKCYNMNHKNVKNYGDITTLNISELPDFDLLTAGFPCKPFSKATSHTNSDKNIYTYMLNIIEYKHPSYILIENVTTLFRDEFRDVYENIITTLFKNDYFIKVVRLNPSSFGYLHDRDRIFIIASIYNISNYNFKNISHAPLDMSYHNILDESVDNYYYINNTDIEMIKQSFKFPLSSIEQFYPIKTPTRKSRYNNKFYIRPPNAPMFTLTSRSKHGIIIASSKKFVCRVITPEEMFRLVGLTDTDIKLDGLSNTAKYILVGNGWDINIVGALLKILLYGESK